MGPASGLPCPEVTLHAKPEPKPDPDPNPNPSPNPNPTPNQVPLQDGRLDAAAEKLFSLCACSGEEGLTFKVIVSIARS